MPESRATSIKAGGGRLGKRTLLFAAGVVCVVVGVVGIVVPLLPTTPLLLLAAFCFGRSSDRAYRWLTTNAVFGRYLRRYVEGEGLSWPMKAFILVLMWGAALASAFWVIDWLVVRVVLFLIVLAVSVHITRLRPRSNGNLEGRGASPPPLQQEITVRDDLGSS